MQCTQLNRVHLSIVVISVRHGHRTNKLINSKHTLNMFSPNLVSVAVLITLMYVNAEQNLTPIAHNGSSQITVYMNIST